MPRASTGRAQLCKPTQMDDMKDCSTDPQPDTDPLGLQGSPSCPFGMSYPRQGPEQGTSALQSQCPFFFTPQASDQSTHLVPTLRAASRRGNATSHPPPFLPALPGCACSKASSREGWKVPPISDVVGISLTIQYLCREGGIKCPHIVHEGLKENSVSCLLHLMPNTS